MSEKYLQEIEEILKEAEAAPPPEKDESAPPPRTSGRYVLRPPRLGRGRPLPYLSAGKVGLAAMGILLLALVVGGAFGPEWLFVGFVIGLLVVAYLMFFARPSGPNVEKRWRGRPIDDEPDDPWSKFNRWTKR